MWKTTILGCAAFSAVVVCLSSPFAHAQEEARKGIVMNHFRRFFNEPLENIVKKAYITDVKIAVAKEEFDEAVTATFAELRRRDLMNNKMISYEKYWKNVVKPESPRILAIMLTSYAKNLILAAEGGRCTVSASASGGNGAVVKCAKAADANDGPFNELGISTVQAEVEKANYVFIAFRNGKETGRTDQKDCTGSTQTVEISEP
jgi:hypothetical protein